MKTLFLIAIAVFAAWVAGVRVHPEVAPDYFRIYLEKDYRRIDFRNGTQALGEFVAERDGRVEMKVREQLVNYPVSDIERMKQIGPVEICRALGEGKILMPAGKPLFSFRPEDGLFSHRKLELAAPR
ncbi:MAG TPA: hypothetical protein VL688_12220 [Verrucomicrobiae bacterium]|nr:hypothetical protein [Verrucomicrobiae bacterium]